MAAMNKSLGKLWVDDGFGKIHIERRGVIQLVERLTKGIWECLSFNPDYRSAGLP